MISSLNGYRSRCHETAERIVCQDKGTKSKYTAVNRQRHQVRQYLIDGDVICDRNVNKCDWMVTEEELMDAYLIELKGSNIEKAIRQLESTRDILAPVLKRYRRIRYRIVPTKVTHKLYNTEFKKFKQKHPKKGEFLCQEKLEENIN